MYRIKELRLERGWTQEYLGHMMNVNKSAISKYENGKSDLTAQIIINLSRIFEVSSDYLLGISSLKTPLGYKHNNENTFPLLENENYKTDYLITTEDKKVLHYFNRLDEENQDAAKGYMVHLYKDQIDSSKTKK